MEQPSQMVVQQIRLFSADIVPFYLIRTAPGAEYLKRAFAFRDSFVNENGEVAFTFGALTHEDEGVLAINLLTIGERKIVLNVAGSSGDASRFYASLVEAVSQLSADCPLASVKPLILTQETTTSARLDLRWADFLAPQAVSALEGRVLAKVGIENEATIKTVGLKVVVAFSPNAELLRHGISLADKTIIIEPRINTPLEDHIFFVTTPLDSATHLQLIEDLERTLAPSAG